MRVYALIVLLIFGVSVKCDASTPAPTYTPTSDRDTPGPTYAPTEGDTPAPTYTPTANQDTPAPTYTPTAGDTPAPTYTPTSTDVFVAECDTALSHHACKLLSKEKKDCYAGADSCSLALFNLYDLLDSVEKDDLVKGCAWIGRKKNANRRCVVPNAAHSWKCEDQVSWKRCRMLNKRQNAKKNGNGCAWQGKAEGCKDRK